ncbi:MAG: 50S ribosomal protein L11 methyltransferase [Firmicutes bacterium]|nr:50S ribosomal protein L11 methyltransferase [Bacillota bacterium]
MAIWQEVKIVINRTALEGAYAVLGNWGIDNFAVDDTALIAQAERLGWGDYFPEVEPSEQVAISCYFSEQRLSQEEQEQLKKELQNLSEFGFEPGLVLVHENEVREEDWAHAWKAYYHPLRIGNIWIQPSWETLEHQPVEGQVVVQLDPGMAFGSGTHPSTSMCIELLQNLNLQDRLLWDVGTGSGILAIVAAKLGARVEAVDIDPVAVRVASENRDLNGLGFPVSQGSLNDLNGQPQVVVANIVAHVIAPMLPVVYEVLAPRGYFIASGVIQDRDPEILTLAKQANLRLVRRLEKGEWVGYLFQRGE